MAFDDKDDSAVLDVEQDAESAQVARKNWNRYQYARDRGHLEFCRKIEQNEAMWLGNHWERETLAQLGDRPAVTMNITFSVLELIVGQQIESRADITYKPKKNSTSDSATTISKLVNQTNDDQNYHMHETQAFFDGMLCGRGYLEIEIGRDDNESGEVRIKSVNPAFVIPDPDGDEYDPDSWNDVIITRFYSYDDIETMYGEEKAQLVKQYGQPGINANSGDLTFDGIKRNAFGGDSDRVATGVYDSIALTDGGDVIYRIVERQKWVREETRCFRYPTGDVRIIPDRMTPEEVNEKVVFEGVSVITRKMNRVRVTVSTENCLIFDGLSPYRHFTIVPYFPYFHRGTTMAMVDNLIGPQKLINKTISQILHVVNTTANSGWVFEQGSLVNKDAQDLEEDGASTGLVLEYREGKQAPTKIQPNSVPPGLDRLFNIAVEMIKEISGASDAARGLDSPEVSGVAIQAKQKRFGVTLARALTNLSLTREMVARRELDIIQDFYTDERVVMIAKEGDSGNAEYESLTVNEITPDGQVVNDLTIGEYGIAVSNSPVADTFGESMMAQAFEFYKEGMPIPPEFIIGLSNFPRKAELIEKIKANAQGNPDAARAEMEKFAAEIAEKIAKTEKTKEEARRIRMQTTGDATTVGEKLVMNPSVGPVADVVEQGIDAPSLAEQQSAPMPQPQEQMADQEMVSP